MSFNSYEFLFAFLPVTLVVYWGLGAVSRLWVRRWLVVASLFFYGWWRPLNVLIIAPSVLINFLVARRLRRLNTEGRTGAARITLIGGICFNVAFLGYFKYANFFIGTVNDVFGGGLVFQRIVLPLGVSFITFQKIGFLCDVHAGKVEEFSFTDYCLFVLFFPQLIAGPIVHYQDMMPQFRRVSCGFDKENLAVGLTLFVFGLFKKAVLADSIAPMVTALYEQAASGTRLSLLPAWMAAVGFTFQIYFDFSGYSDMALGLARMIGVRFPANFYSPLRASSIIDFWLRWHITLTRFLTAYVYNPLSLWLTRRSMARRSPGARRQIASGTFLTLLMVPTLLTMLISGLWHGAGYLFVLWGLVHGVFLVVNHAWRRFGPRLWSSRASYTRFMKPVGLALTFACVASAMVLFRSATLPAALSTLKGMAGLNGVDLPAIAYDRMTHLPSWVHRAASGREQTQYIELKALMAWTVGLGVIALALPNTLQILAPYAPTLETGIPASRSTGASLTWSPSPAWAVGVSVLAWLCVLRLGGSGEFLYWQF